MKKLLFVFFLLGNYSLINAQDVQWAFRILDYSSQNGKKEFSAKQALGKPNVLPTGGENIKAWQPKAIQKDEFIKVGFLIPLKAKHILIAESFHPGYITKIYGYNAEGNSSLARKPTCN